MGLCCPRQELFWPHVTCGVPRVDVPLGVACRAEQPSPWVRHWAEPHGAELGFWTVCDGLFCSALTTEGVGIAAPAPRAQDQAASEKDEGAGGQGGGAPVPGVGASPRAAAGSGFDSAAAALCGRVVDQLHQPDHRQVSHGEPASSVWPCAFHCEQVWALGVPTVLGPCFNETDSYFSSSSTSFPQNPKNI